MELPRQWSCDPEKEAFLCRNGHDDCDEDDEDEVARGPDAGDWAGGIAADWSRG